MKIAKHIQTDFIKFIIEKNANTKTTDDDDTNSDNDKDDADDPTEKDEDKIIENLLLEYKNVKKLYDSRIQVRRQK